MAGVRVAVKDNICLAGIPMLNGTEMLEGFVPREDATVVMRLLDAGAEIVGKTAVPAFCFDGGSVTGYPKPEPENPYDAARLPGASSSGSAVVVALGRGRYGARRRPGRFGADAGVVERDRRPQADVGAGAVHGRVPDRADAGSPRADVPQRARLRPHARGDRRAGRARSAPGRRGDAALLLELLERGAEGLRVGILTEGFGWPDASEPDVDEAVRAAAQTFESLGATVGEVSVPIHRDGLAIWTAIAAEGATELMIKGNGMGTNWRGHYTTDLSDFVGKARAGRSRDFSPTVKLTILVGEYMAQRYDRHYYAKGQNLSRLASARYNAALVGVRRARDADDRDEGAATPGR